MESDMIKQKQDHAKVVRISDPELPVRQEIADIRHLKSDIVELVCRIPMITKAQIWEYFKPAASKAAVSHILNDLSAEKVLYVADGYTQTDHNGIEIQGSIHYIPDPRLLDTDYYRDEKNTNMANSWKSMEKFRCHREKLESRVKAFWIFLDMKNSGGASSVFPVDAKDFPFILLGFFMHDALWEILYIRKGEEEKNLLILYTKEKYMEEASVARRIVLVDDKAQAELVRKMHIAGIKSFAVIGDDGSTEYFS